jgi:hypothetical protein
VKEAGDVAVAAKRDGRTARAIGISSRIRGFPKRATEKAMWAQRSSEHSGERTHTAAAAIDRDRSRREPQGAVSGRCIGGGGGGRGGGEAQCGKTTSGRFGLIDE